ncbi:MAG: DEAD/DEAH box helicase family protein, partial [Veillonella sp.]|nr:DEAD/DEAH box helicase family protein [Veillonella sp.]
GFLKFHDIERRPKTEWFYFNGTPEKSEGLFNKFIRHDVSGYQPGKSNEYALRREQDEAVTKTAAYFTSHENSEFLWNAKPRFGKTLSAYDLVKRLGVTNVLVLTNRPAVANSWYDDFDQFIAGNTEYKFISSTDSLKDRPSMSREQFIEYLNEHDAAKQIAFISLQDLKGSKYFGGEYDKLKWVADLHWDLVIIDEAHEAVDTRKSDFAFSNIHRRWTLHLSGTPFKSIAKGQFSDEQIYNWSYADEQQAKKNWDSTCESESPYEALPQLNMFTYQMSKMVLDVINNGVTVDGENYDYAFDLNEFFATNESGEFVHKEAVVAWLDTLTHNEKYPFSTKDLRNELKHTFWILDRVNSAKALKKLLENHPTFENYGIVLAAGSGNAYEHNSDEGTENLRSLAAVRKAIADHEKTITLSVGQLTTGVTVPEWTGVIMLCNMKSPAQYMQAAFRAQNPYSWTEKGQHYRKERAYVFDFAPERTLIIYDKFANDLSMATANGHGTTDERKENIGELLNFFPVIAEDSSGRMIEIDAAQVMTIPKQIKAQEVVKRGFMSNLLFDNIAGIFRATQTVLDILSELPEASQGKVVMGNDDIDIVDVDLDDDDNPIVSDEIVINKQEALFGDKLRSSIANIENTIRNEDLKPTLEDMLSRVTAPVITPIVQEMQETYGLKNRAAQRIEKDIKDAIKMVAEENDKAQNVAIAHKEAEYKEKIEAATSDEEKLAIETEREEAISAVKVEYKDKFTKDISTTLHELPKQ